MMTMPRHMESNALECHLQAFGHQTHLTALLRMGNEHPSDLTQQRRLLAVQQKLAGLERLLDFANPQLDFQALAIQPGRRLGRTTQWIAQQSKKSAGLSSRVT